ncbi:penicillin-binding transpeptidase domain-containing protein [Oryzomonas rubra]|uniref:Penicillin-binding protein n=1 Tax=Oryzomonas rubra TaxID=2509454 RepID=A0A5A9XKV8_9BACT|nr:penicillin-binding transpeptidase domain-containing protein [Oryzomonas rubra]KAA0893544.1 penicillin-binding protein [Oryzomonas rubra]
MQDLKHLSRKKQFSAFRFFGFYRSNRKIKDSGERTVLRLPIPVGKRREQLKHILLFLAVVLALTPVCALVYQKSPHMVRAVTLWLHSHSTPDIKAAEAAKPPASGSFESAVRLFDTAVVNDGQLTARSAGGDTLHYTIKDDLQKRVHDFMAQKQVPFGVFVAIEPSTGRILAMTSYSSVDPQWPQSAFFDLYPMASLFKIIIASAALENKKITPQTVVEFRGAPYSENPRYWDISPRGNNNRMDVGYAMGKSINPVYGRVANNIVGKASVMEYVHKFGFNQALFPGVPVKASKTSDPQPGHALMLMGAGLDHEVKISPLHAAVIMGAIANQGRMMVPTLTDKVVSAAGTEKDGHKPRELRRLVSPETAASLTQMLSNTVTRGTSRRAFHDRRGRPMLAGIDIAAKTGSIDGISPKGHYSWFAAYAPAHEPRIALVALVINQDRWKIKSAQVGEQALEEFFRH